MALTLSRKKFIAFALMAMALSVAGVVLLLLVADLVLHARAERSAGPIGMVIEARSSGGSKPASCAS